MQLDTFVQELAQTLQLEKIAISLKPRAHQVLGSLGSDWLAAAMKPYLLLNPGKGVRFEIHQVDDEPMIAVADAKKLPRTGVIVVGDNPDIAEVAHLDLPTPELLAGASKFAFGQRTTAFRKVVSKVYTGLYSASPLLLDSYRQWRNDNASLPVVGDQISYYSNYPAEAAQEKNMWVAMHWAETGGAEAWGFEQAKLAKAAGFKLVFTFDRAAPQRLLAKALELSDDVYLVGNGLRSRDYQAFVEKLVTVHRISHIHIHHSALAYQLLPTLRLLHPGLRIEDSTHIAEYRGGGFVQESVQYSGHIDLHHVISSQLVQVYTEAGVPRGKLAFHPLTGFTSSDVQPRLQSAAPTKPLKVGFLGRLSAQKRPYLFQRVARISATRHRGEARFIMQGSGELEPLVVRDAKRLRLDKVVERRSWAPAKDLLAEVDVLLITSDNEGLTLTSLEADAAGVLVISADVGSQRDVIADEALLPRMPVKFVQAAVKLLHELSQNPDLFNRLLAKQHEKVQAIAAKESASDFFARHYQELEK